MDRSETMRRVHGRDTTPEMRVRRLLHAAGFRYRLQRRDLPGKPDLVLPRFRIALFVNGCFWHWHGCKRSRMPATNRDYWERKIGRNVARDRVNAATLAGLGWDVRVIWECELAAATEALIGELLGRDNIAAEKAHCRSTAIPSRSPSSSRAAPPSSSRAKSRELVVRDDQDRDASITSA